MLNLNELYKQVENPNVTRDELLDIIDAIEFQQVVGNFNYDKVDILFKIATLPICTDDLIIWMYQILKEQGTTKNKLGTILDYTTKIEFDKLWSQGNFNRQWSILMYSKWCDSKQLMEYYNDEVVGLKASLKGLMWTKNNLHELLKLRNCPVEVQNENLDTIENIIRMAHIPIPTVEVQNLIKQYLSTNTSESVLFEVFVENSELPFDRIVELASLSDIVNSIDIEKTMKELKWGKHKLNSFYKFVKKPSTPDFLKVLIFDYTNNTDFLPETTQEIFLF